MTLVRVIAPEWKVKANPSAPQVLEGEFDDTKIKQLNEAGYNIYSLPNSPSIYTPGKPVDGADIDQFQYVFVDFDLKQGAFDTKEEFLDYLSQFKLQPTRIVDSGFGVHVYWHVSDLDPLNFLRLQRRLCRRLRTDEAVSKIYQLMRLPGTLNTKKSHDLRPCLVLLDTDSSYTSEQLDAALPSITPQDEQYCQDHYNKTKNITNNDIKINDKIPLKFTQLLSNNLEVKNIWMGNVKDRSTSDYRLAHIMFANGFKREEAMSVLVNAAKALERTPQHRVGYAQAIVDKLWDKDEIKARFKSLSNSVQNILMKDPETLKGIRFPCYPYLDNTDTGFRLGHVIVLAGGTGIGKTAICLNAFMGFVQNNPDYVHFFVSLEQSRGEIAIRWNEMCGDNKTLNSMVQIIDNHDDDGTFRDLSLKDIDDYIATYQTNTGKKVGCVAIDHLGILSNNTSVNDGEFGGIKKNARGLKPFAERNNILVIVLSQVPREKASLGDIELDVNSAYGSAFIEHIADYLITVWQPLKRVYHLGAPTLTAIKFCKIRHKKVKKDIIQENVRYLLHFDSDTQRLESMTQDLEKGFTFFNSQAISERKKDKKEDVMEYQSAKWDK